MDQRLKKFSHLLVDFSSRVKQGERVAITTSTQAEPLIAEIYALLLERGAHPHVLFDFSGQEEIFFKFADDSQLDFLPTFHKTAFDEFEVIFKIRADNNTRAMSLVSFDRQRRRQKALSYLLSSQMRRGSDHSLRWVTTQYPTEAYAMEAEMGYQDYQDFVYKAMHVDESTNDPIAYWQRVKDEQARIIQAIEGHDLVELQGPNVDLKLSIQDRKFCNGWGEHNLPDGEIYTGVVEDSVNGWVRYTFPAIYQNREVEGIELYFEAGKVVKASAKKNQDYLLNVLETDAGARYVGEFAIGTNMEINRFTHNTLFDEKIGGSFHTALGSGYPETGSQNQSMIHWDMICDLRIDSQILVDGAVFYKNGQFLV